MDLGGLAGDSNKERNLGANALAVLWKTEDSLDLYGINRWGRDYFSVNRKGRLSIRPSINASQYADVREIVDKLVADGVGPPILLRFPQLIQDRIGRLYSSFRRAKEENGYTGHLRAVFPMKVNQEREVLESILNYGRKYDYGLEVGSKPELLAALALPATPRSLLVCNGYKDPQFMELACLGAYFHKNTVIVIDRLHEVDLIIDAIKQTGAKPMLGMRMKLMARGGGKWVESGGERSKFGLSVPAILDAIDALKKAKLLKNLRMLHFHIGSQITDIKRINNGTREATRLYAEMVRLKVPIKYLDIGGGMGIDYDGSQSTSSMSCNYGLEEYASGITYTIKSICDDEGVPHPDIVTETGRGVTAPHSMLVAEVLDAPRVRDRKDLLTVRADDPLPMQELRTSLDEIGPANYLEVYHDALVHRDDLMSLFNLGQIDIRTRAHGELLFRSVCERAIRYVKKEDDEDEFQEELSDLKRLLGHKWVVNYSLFQSTPDVWGVRQVFPIAPLQRLDEEPKETGTVCDLTCDSDGEVKRFIDNRAYKDVIELHDPEGGPYYLGFFLLGAYQDVLANSHNLFGPPSEVFVRIRRSGKWEIEKKLRAWNSREMLASMNWPPRELAQLIETSVTGAPGVPPRRSRAFLAKYRRALEESAYLRS